MIFKFSSFPFKEGKLHQTAEGFFHSPNHLRVILLSFIFVSSLNDVFWDFIWYNFKHACSVIDELMVLRLPKRALYFERDNLCSFFVHQILNVPLFGC